MKPIGSQRNGSRSRPLNCQQSRVTRSPMLKSLAPKDRAEMVNGDKVV